MTFALRFVIMGLCCAALPSGALAIQQPKSPPAESPDPYFGGAATAQTPSAAKSATDPALKPATASSSPAPAANAPANHPLQPLPQTPETSASSGPLDAIGRKPNATLQPTGPSGAPGLLIPRDESTGNSSPPATQLVSNPPRRTIAITEQKPTATPPPAQTGNSGAAQSAPAASSTSIIDQLAARARANSQVETALPTETATDAKPQRDLFEPTRVLAIVGGRPILAGDMLYEINERIEQVIPTAPDEIKAQQRERLYSAWLGKFIDQQLLYTDVVRELPAEADVDKMFDGIGESFDQEALPEFLEKQDFTKPLDFDVYLRGLGSSLRKFRQRWIEDQFIKYFVTQKLTSTYEPTHAEMWQYYRDHIDDYAQTARAHWEQIVVRFDRTPNKSEARRQIAELGNKVVYGASFEAVAREHSHDISAKDGGQQGWVNQGSLAYTALDQALFEIPLNELSDIIETAAGFHIVRVLERTGAGTRPFSEVQTEIREQLMQANRGQLLEDYLKRLRREIPIDIVDPSVQLPDDYIID